MTTTEVISKLEEIMCLPSGTLSLDKKLAGLTEWDSIAILSFISFVDESLGITLNASSVQKAESVLDLINLVRENLS